MKCERLGLLMAVGILVSACTPDSEPIPEPQDLRVSGSGSAVHLGRPLFTIGSDSTEEQSLYQVAGAVLLPSGAVLVADSKGLRLFRRDGSFMKMAGGVGDGPGEYGGIAWLHWCRGDSIFVADWSREDISVLDSKAEFVRRFRPLAPTVDRPAAQTRCSENGPLIGWARSTNALQVEEGPYEAEVNVFAVSFTGDPMASFGTLPGPDRYRFPRNDGPRPLGRDFHLAVGDSLVFWGVGDTTAIHLARPSGEKAGTLYWSNPKVRITPDDISRLIEADMRSAVTATREQLAERRKAWEELKFREYYPAFSRLLTDDHEWLWIRNFPRVGADSVTWLVIDPEFRLRYLVTMPSSMQVQAIKGDTLLVSHRDQLGRETIQARVRGRHE